MKYVSEYTHMHTHLHTRTHTPHTRTHTRTHTHTHAPSDWEVQKSTAFFKTMDQTLGDAYAEMDDKLERLRCSPFKIAKIINLNIINLINFIDFKDDTFDHHAGDNHRHTHTHIHTHTHTHTYTRIIYVPFVRMCVYV